MTSIRTGLVYRLLLIFIVLFGTVDVVIYVTIDRFLDANMDAGLMAKAKARSSLVSQGSHALDIDWLGLADQLNQRGNPDLVQIQDNQGHVLGGEPGPAIAPPSLQNEVAYWNLPLSPGRMYRAVALRFIPHVDDDPSNSPATHVATPCVLIVATDRSGLDETQVRLGAILAGVTTTALLASSFLIFWGVTRGLVTLREFGSSVSGIDATSLSARLATEGLPLEVSPIAEKLNDLLSRLEVSFVRERRFSADVSHELRTPIAEIRSISEVMLRQPGLSGEVREGFQDVFNASRQMEALVAALLEIVRGEHAGSTLEIGRVDIGLLIEATWKSHAPRAREKNLQVHFHVPDELGAQTDERLLRLVLNNLFSNAVDYTPAGGSIEADARRDGERFAISIQNSSHDVGWEDLAHFFERFWRKDKVRNDSTHFGLGLSVTQLLCQRLNIHLTVSMVKKDMVKFWLTSGTSATTSRETRALANELSAKNGAELA